MWTRKISKTSLKNVLKVYFYSKYVLKLLSQIFDNIIVIFKLGKKIKPKEYEKKV